MAGKALAERRTRVDEQAGVIGANWLLPALVALFFVTGISGLIYQVLWLRLLSLVFGVTIWAASTVLASFMAGLALGSFAAGKLVDRAHQPLRWYGIAEVLVGLSALATPVALSLLEQLYVALYPALPQSLPALTVVRFVLSFAVLIVPTTLMGATLPIIVKSSLLRSEGLGERVSLLYATNTFGAIVGTLVAGFVLVGGIGISHSFLVAAALNVLAGVAAIALSLARREAAPARSLPAAPPTANGQRPTANGHRPLTDDRRPVTGDLPESARRAVLLVFGLSGLVSLALEVVWFRVLVLFMDVTTYAFTIMLAVYLCGIAAGSYLIAPFMQRRWNWLLVLAGLEIAIGVAALLSMALLSQSYNVLWAYEKLIGRSAQASLVPAIATSFLAIFPPTLLMGIAFPIGLRLWSGERDGEHTGERIGVFYSLNVFGAILGSLLAGFLLLPVIGSERTLIVLSALSLLAGLWLLWLAVRSTWSAPSAARGRAPALGRAPLIALVGVALFGLCAATMPSPFSVVLQYRYGGERTLWREEGIQTTVTVNERPDGHRVLYLDGLHQANDEGGMVFLHRLIGYLPMTLHPDPKRALVIGLGGGVTAGAVAEHAATQVDVVELAGSVVRGSDLFTHVNGDVTRRPNVRMREDDGRNFLLLSPPKQYDVITADIIQPFHAGAGNLYSVEYFRLAHRALKDDGVMLQWIGPLPETQYKLIMRSFLEVFPDTTLWMEGALMVGAKRPLRLDPAVYERKLADPVTGAVLKGMRFGSLPELFAIYWAGPAEMKAYVGRGPLLTDNQQMVEYFRSLPRNEPIRDVSDVRGDALELLAR